MVCPKIIRGDDPRLITVRYKPLVTALPFKDEKTTVQAHSDEDLYEETEYLELKREETEADYQGMRIGTRAHIFYNLQGYNKNAMLLFNATVDFFDGNARMLAKMADIAATFANFQFEIEQHVDMTDEEIDEKCGEFLQRDCTDYGCVAVVVITMDGLGYNDSTIVRYWRTDGNPTLRNKPKMYIHEGEFSARVGWPINRRGSFYAAPITEDHPDVLCLHVPAWPHDSATRSLQILCKKLEGLADYDDLVTIIKEAIRDTKPMYRVRIFVASTMDRRLFLTRTENEVSRL